MKLILAVDDQGFGVPSYRQRAKLGLIKQAVIAFGSNYYRNRYRD